MATTVARLEAILSADTRDFDRGMRKSDSTMGKVGKTAGVVGVAIGTGLALAARAGFKEFIEGEKVTAQTNAVLKSTGKSANVTAKEVDKLAMSLSKKSGVDDEVIQGGENMLLTFTRIRNETGKGKDIFNQATKATLDLSVAMGKDMTSSSILVGKALNDPIKGLTALTRVGVTFSEETRDQIKAMVNGKDAAQALSEVFPKLSAAQTETAIKMAKAGEDYQSIADTLKLKLTPANRELLDSLTKGGNVMGAQKIILQELQKEFGGSAEAAGKTFAGQLNILKNAFAELMAMIVGGVMPALLSLVKHMQTAVTWLQNNEKAAKILFVALGILAGAMIAARAAQLLLNLAILANPYVAVAALIATFGLAMVVAYQRSDTFKEKVNNLWAALRNNPLVELAGLIADLSAKLSGAQTRTEGLKRWTEVLWESIKNSPLGGYVKGLMAIADAVQEIVKWIDKFVAGVKWLTDHIPKIPKLPGWVPGVGDPADPNMTLPGPPGSGGSLMGALPIMQPFADAAAGYGLHVTSGLRPGARTRHGTLSDHALGKALDEADGPSQMAAFFRSLIGNPRVKQAFYDPLGSIFGGVWSSYREGGHSDHVHVATYDQGGWLKPGLTLAMNNTGRPERVGGGGLTINVNGPIYGSKEHLTSMIQNAAAEFKRRNGRPLV